ncbi:hypothetical protein ACFZB9_22295 [Kitasatospora sp. NPDC008050]|uniref:hypothetical protein n=1 Tax=Kitasatospora sp. NPDC008050 TaxID=3364021 RepID=UPI0036DFA663
MTARPIEHHAPQSRLPETIREFRAVLPDGDLRVFNSEVEDVPLHEIDRYLEAWQHVLRLRAIPEIGDALRSAGDRPGTPIGEIFSEWEEAGV